MATVSIQPNYGIGNGTILLGKGVAARHVQSAGLVTTTKKGGARIVAAIDSEPNTIEP